MAITEIVVLSQANNENDSIDLNQFVLDDYKGVSEVLPQPHKFVEFCQCYLPDLRTGIVVKEVAVSQVDCKIVFNYHTMDFTSKAIITVDENSEYLQWHNMIITKYQIGIENQMVTSHFFQSFKISLSLSGWEQQELLPEKSITVSTRHFTKDGRNICDEPAMPLPLLWSTQKIAKVPDIEDWELL